MHFLEQCFSGHYAQKLSILTRLQTIRFYSLAALHFFARRGIPFLENGSHPKSNSIPLQSLGRWNCILAYIRVLGSYTTAAVLTPFADPPRPGGLTSFRNFSKDGKPALYIAWEIARVQRGTIAIKTLNLSVRVSSWKAAFPRPQILIYFSGNFRPSSCGNKCSSVLGQIYLQKINVAPLEATCKLRVCI